MGRTRVCARCRGPLPPYPGTGRRPRYCRAACRKAAYRARAQRPVTDRSEWWAPPHLVQQVVQRWPVGLDAAACAASTLVADNWLGPTHPEESRRDALTGPAWAQLTPAGTIVWLNPPYTPTPTLRAFLSRAIDTRDAGTPVLALVPASTGSLWWHDLVVAGGARVEFLRGRLCYGGPHSTGGPAPWPSALVSYQP